MHELWYFTKDGRNRLGPFLLEQLRQLAGAGLIAPGDMLLREGDRAWVRAGTLRPLFPGAAAPAPEPPGRPSPAAGDGPVQFMSRAMCAVERRWFSILYRRDAGTGVWFAERTYRRGDAAEGRYPVRDFTGTFARGESYPGCPYCGNASVFQCACGIVNCMDGAILSGSVVSCSGCGSSGQLTGEFDRLGGSSEL